MEDTTGCCKYPRESVDRNLFISNQSIFTKFPKIQNETCRLRSEQVANTKNLVDVIMQQYALPRRDINTTKQ